MRLGKRERALAKAIKVRNDAVVTHNMRQPKPQATSGMRMARIDTASLMGATHHMGYLEAGRGKSRPEPKRDTCSRWSNK